MRIKISFAVIAVFFFLVFESEPSRARKHTSEIWWEMRSTARLFTSAIAFSAMASTATEREKARPISIPSLATSPRPRSSADRRRVEACLWTATCMTPSAVAFMPAECLPGSL